MNGLLEFVGRARVLGGQRRPFLEGGGEPVLERQRGDLPAQAEGYGFRLRRGHHSQLRERPRDHDQAEFCPFTALRPFHHDRVQKPDFDNRRRRLAATDGLHRLLPLRILTPGGRRQLLTRQMPEDGRTPDRDHPPAHILDSLDRRIEICPGEQSVRVLEPGFGEPVMPRPPGRLGYRGPQIDSASAEGIVERLGRLHAHPFQIHPAPPRSGVQDIDRETFDPAVGPQEIVGRRFIGADAPHPLPVNPVAAPPPPCPQARRHADQGSDHERP